MRDSIGLALGSGSARGLAHVGVLKVFEKHNIPVHCIAGSSIGAIIGAHYCAFQSATRLEKLIFDISEKKLYQFLDPTVKGGFLKGNKISAFFEDVFKDVGFESLRIPFAAVATDMYSGNKVVLKSGDLVKAIRASISIPAILRPVTYDKMLLADGGLSDPIPVDVAQSMGAQTVVAVNLDTYVHKTPHKKFIPISRIPLNSINILRHNLALSSVRGATYVVAPVIQSEFFSWQDFFDAGKVKSFIEEGERAAEEIVPVLKSAPKTALSGTQKEESILSKFFNIFR